MKILVELDPNTYERISKLLAEGKYDSVEQFLRAGAANQLTIESTETGDEEEAMVGDSSPLEEYQWGYSVPDEVPVREPHPGGRQETLLFSQYYRFLPLKFVLLELANETSAVGDPVDLESFREHAAESVISVRDSLINWEEANEVAKHDRYSTGFPKRDAADPDRTMTRFLNHYVGRYRPEKQEPSGFGHQLGLLSIMPTDEGGATIAMSPPGERFLRLENPLLMAGPGSVDHQLSDSEQNFLVAHIRAELGLEYDFMDFVYDTLEHHRDTYTKALDRFRLFLERSPGFTDDPDDNRVRSHTAGTISRMVSLGVLKRGQRRGVYQTARPLETFQYPETTPSHRETNEPSQQSPTKQ